MTATTRFMTKKEPTKTRTTKYVADHHPTASTT
jgi:hypothetical protein